MAAGRGASPFKSSWALNRLSRGYTSSTQTLEPVQVYGDVDKTEQTIWTEWWFLLPVLTAYLVDNFNDNSLNTALWTSYGSGYTETSQQAQITCAIGAGYSGLNSKARYDLTGSYAKIEVVNAGNQALTSLEAYPLQLNADNNNKLQWRINSGNIMARRTVGGSTTDSGSTTYNSTTHKYLKIREASGTIYWDYSSDGASWNNLFSIAKPISITSLLYDVGAGTFSTEASSTTVIYDNLNIDIAPASTSSNQYLMMMGVG